MDLLGKARDLAARVEREASAAGIPVAVCVVDVHGNLVLQHRMNGAPLFSLEISERKAYTSALVRILGQVADSVREHTVVHQRAYLDYWRELLADATSSGEVRADLDHSVTVMMLTGTLNWAVEWYRPDGRLTREELATVLVAVVLDGLLARPD